MSELFNVPIIEISAVYDIVERTPDMINHIREDFIHVSDKIQIFYNRIGRHLITLETHNYEPEEGEIVIIHPWQPHRIHCLDENSRYSLVQFSPSIFEHLATIPHIKTDIQYWINQAGKAYSWHLKLNEKQRSKIENFFELYNSHSGFAVDIFRFATFLSTLSYLCICIKRHAEFNSNVLPKNSIAEKAMDYISKHFSEQIFTADVARALHISEKHLCNMFKKQSGFTIKQYISRCRIRLAVNILQEPNKTAKDAFNRTGYQDYPTFLRMFKKIIGKTPTEYQKIYNEHRKSYPKQLLEKLSSNLPNE